MKLNIIDNLFGQVFHYQSYILQTIHYVKMIIIMAKSFPLLPILITYLTCRLMYMTLTSTQLLRTQWDYYGIEYFSLEPH